MTVDVVHKMLDYHRHGCLRDGELANKLFGVAAHVPVEELIKVIPNDILQLIQEHCMAIRTTEMRSSGMSIGGVVYMPDPTGAFKAESKRCFVTSTTAWARHFGIELEGSLDDGIGGEFK
ncbi:hypothetical protein BH11PLA2_BH11PLA2_29400 [soil metagenome]